MKVIEHIEKAKDPLFSFEIIPPKRGTSVQEITDIVMDLQPFNPPFIDVTSHSAEAYYEENEDEYGLEDAGEEAEEYGEGFNYGDLGRVHFTHDLLARNLMYNNIGELKNKILKMNLTPQENFAIILNAHFQDDRYKYNLTEEDLKFMLDKVVESVILQDEVKFINPKLKLLPKLRGYTLIPLPVHVARINPYKTNATPIEEKNCARCPFPRNGLNTIQDNNIPIKPTIKVAKIPENITLTPNCMKPKPTIAPINIY